MEASRRVEVIGTDGQLLRLKRGARFGDGYIKSIDTDKVVVAPLYLPRNRGTCGLDDTLYRELVWRVPGRAAGHDPRPARTQ